MRPSLLLFRLSPVRRYNERMPRKLGQHFLKNKDAIKKTVAALDVKDGDIVIEVGPGHGELTEYLKMQKSKCKIIAIEKDARLANFLEKKFLSYSHPASSPFLRHPESSSSADEGSLHGDSSPPKADRNDRKGGWRTWNNNGEESRRVEIIHGDILKILPTIIAEVMNEEDSRAAEKVGEGLRPSSDIVRLKYEHALISLLARRNRTWASAPERTLFLPHGNLSYKLIGNIPYYLTGYLLRTISELPILPERAVFMIQKEVAERIVALPPRMNLLAASVRYWSDPKIIAAVSKDDFSPPPKVESAVILLKTLPSATKTRTLPKENYYRAVKLLFAHPRKTILNNIRPGFHPFQNDFLGELERAGINPEGRPQNLSVHDIKKISEIVYNMNE